MKRHNFDLDGMLQDLQNRNRSKAGDFTSKEEFKAKLYERIEADAALCSRNSGSGESIGNEADFFTGECSTPEISAGN
jgi:hypothetical protein